MPDDNSDRSKRKNSKSLSNLFGIFHKKKASTAKTPVNTPPCGNDDFQMKTSEPAENSKRPKSANKTTGSKRSKTPNRDYFALPKERDKDDCDIEEVVRDEKLKNVLREEDMERCILMGRKIIEEEFVRQTEEAARNEKRLREKSIRERKANKSLETHSNDSKGSIECKESGKSKLSKVSSGSKDGSKIVKKEASKALALPPPQEDGVRRSWITPNQNIQAKSPSYKIEYRLVQGQMVARYVPKQ